jgi:hypothetical protein
VKTNVFNIIFPTPDNKISPKNAERGKRQDKLLRNNILNKLWLKGNKRWRKKAKGKPFLKWKITKFLILRAFFHSLSGR